MLCFFGGFSFNFLNYINMKLNNIITTIVLVIQACSCKDHPIGSEITYSFKLRNNTDKSISVLISYLYPDTSMPNTPEFLGGINAHDWRYIDSDKPWAEVIIDLPNDTMSIFFIDNDSLSLYGFGTIRESLNILDRFDVSVADLPPNDAYLEFP
jgi:hypothetical protein